MDQQIKNIKGFKFNGFSIPGMDPNRKQLAIILGDSPLAAHLIAGPTADNSAPIAYNKKNFNNHQLQALVLNSQNVNAHRGEFGTKDVTDIVQRTATTFNINEEHVACLSSGPVKKSFPITDIKNSIIYSMGALENEKRAFINTAKATLNEDVEPLLFADTLLMGKLKANFLGFSNRTGNKNLSIPADINVLLTDINISSEILSFSANKAANEVLKWMDSEVNQPNFNNVTILSSQKADHNMINSENDPVTYKLIDFLKKAFRKLC